MDLSGFSAFDFSEGVPYFSITQNGLTFNKAVVLKLGSPAASGYINSSGSTRLFLLRVPR